MANDPEKSGRPNPFDGLRKVVFIAGLLFIAWILLGQIGLRFLHPQRPPAADEAAMQTMPETLKEKDAQILELRARIDQMDAKLRILEDVVAGTKPAGDMRIAEAGTAETPDRVARLEEKIDRQEETLSDIKTQIGVLDAKATQRLTALAAFTPLKDTVLRGEPFKAQLEQITQLTNDDAKTQAVLAQLAPYAESGAVTLAVLQSWFDLSVSKALAANPQTNPLMRNLQSLVQVRKVGEQPGSDDESILARAETRLGRGDVDAAAKELAALSPTAAMVFAPWLSNAQIFLQVHGSLDALQLALAQDGAPEPAKAPAAAPE